VFLLWIPTWTRQGLMQSLQRTKDFQNVARIVHHTEAELGPTLAQAKFYKEGYSSQQKLINDLGGAIHKSHVIIGNLSSELEATDRKMKGIQHPTKPLEYGRPQIPYVAPPPVTGKIGRAISHLDVSTYVVLACWVAAIIAIIVGWDSYMLDASRTGGFLIGGLFFLGGLAVYIMKMRHRVPIVEYASEGAEAVTEELE
jgi:hypothetical protein